MTSSSSPALPGALRPPHHLAAWIALGLVLLLIGVVALGGRRPASVEQLHGPWQRHTVRPDGSVLEDRVDLPATWSSPAGPPGASTFLTRTVTVGPEPIALWIQGPRFGIEVTWDGAPIASRSGIAATSSAPLLVVLPAASPESSHELGLDIRGAFGEVGVTGDLLLGPVADVHQTASQWNVRALAMALGLAVLAALPLSVASRGPWRPAYTLYGLALAAMAIQVWAGSPQPGQLGMPVSWQLALERSFLWLVCALVLAFASTFVHDRPTANVARLLAVGVLGAACTAVAPASWALSAGLAGDAFSIGVAAWGTQLVLQSFQERVEGRSMLALALVAGVTALITHTSFRFGWSAALPYTLPGILVLMVSLGAALLVRDAATSERHERLLERFPDPLVTVNGQGEITDANPEARMLFEDRIEGQILQRVDPEHHPRFRGHLRRGMQGTDHIEFRAADGRWYESAATPVDDDRILLDLRDITARRDLDRGLLQAARAETTGLLLGGLAHDFNNMLGTLLAHVGILKAQPNAKGVNERLQRMEGSIERAAGLTKRLLTVSRGTGNTLTACDFSAVCQVALELVEPTWPAGIALTSSIEPDLPPVHGDADDLEQVVVNLLVNARDALGETGHVRLVVRRFHFADGARGVAAMVEDDGPGVPRELRDELFQPFVTTKKTGTGLGLAVARQILLDHLGRLWHEPTPGGGARFLLALRHADAVSQAPAPLPKGRRVLLVDDEEVLLEAWHSALADAGYDVTSTPDPVEAIARIREQLPDALVTDLAMSPISGVEVARSLQTRDPRVPILVVSAFIAPDVQAQLSANGWDALTKPVRAARLVAAVGHLRRQAERKAAGQEDITSVVHLFPTLDALSAASLGFRTAAPEAS